MRQFIDKVKNKENLSFEESKAAFELLMEGKVEDQELFEAEFIRATWDKPDLSADEVNLYVNVCVDYINQQKEIL